MYSGYFFIKAITVENERRTFSLVCARVNGVIVGQAFYLRKYYAKHGTMTWVLQLVVKDDYRHKSGNTLESALFVLYVCFYKL